LKPLLAATAVSVGAMAFASPALAFSGDEALLGGPQFRLNPDTLEPGCDLAGRMASKHLDATFLANGDIVKELHITVRNSAPFSVDQVLVPSTLDGYSVYSTGGFDTGSSAHDPDIDPNQTAVDMFAPDSNGIDRRDVIVCVSDHNDNVLNQPYQSDVIPGEVATADRPIVQPIVSCLGASAIAPLNTYKVGFGYATTQWYRPFAEVGLGPITDPQAFADHVLIKYRADQPGVRRVNDFDESGELYSDPHSDKAGYGQPIVFHRNGDAQSYLHKSLPGTVDGGSWPAAFQEAFADQTSALGLLTFTAQGDLPLVWTVKASLAPDSYRKSVTLTDDMLRAWAASWQAYYNGGAKPAMALCPGTNSPAPATTVVVNLPQQSVPVPGTNTVITKETTVIQTVAGKTIVKTVAAKKAKASKKAKKAACMRKAKAKKGSARRRAIKRCGRR
jgi:hypothetical protein